MEEQNTIKVYRQQIDSLASKFQLNFLEFSSNENEGKFLVFMEYQDYVLNLLVEFVDLI